MFEQLQSAIQAVEFEFWLGESLLSFIEGNRTELGIILDSWVILIALREYKTDCNIGIVNW